MKVKPREYLQCDRCEAVIDTKWYKFVKLQKMKKKKIVEGYIFNDELDLCAICSEKFERFMNQEIDDDKPTEYEEHHAHKKNGFRDIKDHFYFKKKN